MRRKIVDSTVDLVSRGLHRDVRLSLNVSPDSFTQSLVILRRVEGAVRGISDDQLRIVRCQALYHLSSLEDPCDQNHSNQ